MLFRSAVVLVDGQEKGAAPLTSQLCEGEHVVELRSPDGRYSRRVDVKAGQRVEVTMYDSMLHMQQE